LAFANYDILATTFDDGSDSETSQAWFNPLYSKLDRRLEHASSYVIENNRDEAIFKPDSDPNPLPPVFNFENCLSTQTIGDCNTPPNIVGVVNTCPYEYYAQMINFSNAVVDWELVKPLKYGSLQNVLYNLTFANESSCFIQNSVPQALVATNLSTPETPTEELLSRSSPPIALTVSKQGLFSCDTVNGNYMIVNKYPFSISVEVLVIDRTYATPPITSWHSLGPAVNGNNNSNIKLVPINCNTSAPQVLTYQPRAYLEFTNCITSRPVSPTVTIFANLCNVSLNAQFIATNVTVVGHLSAEWKTLAAASPSNNNNNVLIVNGPSGSVRVGGISVVPPTPTPEL